MAQHAFARVQDGLCRNVGPAHSDEAAWHMHLLDALGTRSDEFSAIFLGQLEWVCRGRGEAAISETSLNAALAVVDGIEAQNETEAMLGAQMAGTHAVAMELLARARHSEHVQTTSDYANLAVKLLRTYTTQLEALAKIRRGGEQKVTVEHVHVYPGGQAIVGSVSRTPGGGSSETGRQPCGPEGIATLAYAPGIEVRSANAIGEALSVSGNEGQAALQNPRGRSRKRRTGRAS
jgi:hypothetical protein